VKPPVLAPRSTAVQPGHVEAEMLKSVCEFVPAAAEYFSRAVSEMASLRPHGRWVCPGLLVDQNLSRHDGPFRLFAAMQSPRSTSS